MSRADVMVLSLACLIGMYALYSAVWPARLVWKWKMAERVEQRWGLLGVRLLYGLVILLMLLAVGSILSFPRG